MTNPPGTVTDLKSFVDAQYVWALPVYGPNCLPRTDASLANIQAPMFDKDEKFNTRTICFKQLRSA